MTANTGAGKAAKTRVGAVGTGAVGVRKAGAGASKAGTATRYLITGGAGFIGSHFLRYLLNKYKDISVTCVDKLTYAGHMENITDLMADQRLAFVKADIADKQSMKDIFFTFRPQLVVNFAAESHVDRSITAPQIFMRTNVEGVSTLLEASRACGVQRFHQISTDEVYGSLAEGEQNLFTEYDLLRPSSPYSASKAAGDMLALAYFRTYGLPVIITRSANNYGSHQMKEKLIPLIIDRALRNEKIPLYGDGQQLRDWIYVEDHCAAVDRVLHAGRAGEIYNVGSGQELRNIDLTRQILKLLGKDELLIDFTADRPGHDYRYGLDTKKINLELSWKPVTSWAEGLAKTVDWYKKQSRCYM